MYTKHKWNSDHYFNFNYVQYLPVDFDKNKKYPLVFFLHGAGQRGDDLDAAMKHGYMKHVREEGAQYPFIFLAPQCPKEKHWGHYTESLVAFLDDLIHTLPIDEKRVYLTGLSMGGGGTWMLGNICPEKFAAIAPVCGFGTPYVLGGIKELPIYAFHGDCDTVVPIWESMRMVSAINKAGGNAKIKVYYGCGHNCWEQVYSDDELWNWLSSHERKHIDEV